MAKILGHLLLDVLLLADNPQHHKQRHHGRDKIGERDFPGPAVLPPCLDFLGDPEGCHICSQPARVLRGAFHCRAVFATEYPLHVLKARAHIRGNRTSGKFDRQHRGHGAGERQ
jgi:hypothetical protein